MGIPSLAMGGIAGGGGHEQGIMLGFFVSSLPPEFTFIGPMLMGKRHDQQISVMGLTKRPEHA
jgi:hypothetical protein